MHENDTDTQAAFWQATLNSDLLTMQQYREFELWLAESEENRNAWKALDTFWNELDGLSEADINFIANIPDADITEQREKIPFQPIDSQIKKTSFLRKNIFSKPHRGIAASLLILFFVIYPQVPQYFADYHTAAGELLTLTLADGSQIIINSDTTLSVNYSDQQRSITLHQGEAYFDVASDRSRPFEVITRAGKVRALGTEFDIKNRNANVSVTVFEHAVKVSLNNGKIIERLPEGQQLIFTGSASSQPTEANLSRIQSWRKRRIIFQDKPLAEVMAALSHYREGTIIILDSEIKTLSVTGVFATDDTNIALQTIEQSLPVTIQKITEKLVLISAK